MAKLLLSMPNELMEKLEAHCEKYSYEKSEFIRGLLRTKLFGAPIGQPEAYELAMTKKPFFPDNIITLAKDPPDNLLSKDMSGVYANDLVNRGVSKGLATGGLEDQVVEPKYGLCEVCKKNGVIKPTTYLNDDQIRVTEELCLTCINKAKVSGVIRDLEEGK